MSITATSVTIHLLTPRRPVSCDTLELTSRATESVSLVGALARLVGKAASSPALQSTVASFAEYETTIDSTSEMLKKCQRGLADLDELLDGMSEASTRAARPGG